MNRLSLIRSRSVVLRDANIDTDQIIPARFLTTTERNGLGRFAFHDRRLAADGTPDPAFAFNQPHNAGREILIAGPNFGCGSSREHAPWALRDLGLRAVISSRIADIFRSNALKNGLLPVVLEPEVVEALMRDPDQELQIDLVARCVRSADGASHAFELDGFARTCLIEGVDPLGWLIAQIPTIERWESQRHASR